MTKEEFHDINQYRGPIEHYKKYGVYPGMDAYSFKRIYDKVTRENLDLTCSNCLMTALNRTYDLIIEYEKQNP